MPRRPPRRWIVVILCILLGAPATTSFSAEAGTVMSHAVADFSKGTNNNTTVWPQGVMLCNTKIEPSNWMNIGNASPAAQWRPAFDYDTTRGLFIMAGWDYTGRSVGVWTYNAKSDIWTRSPEYNAPNFKDSVNTGVYDNANGKLIIVAAKGRPPTTYSYDTSTNTWTDLNPAQSPTFTMGGAMAYDTDSGEIYHFGGLGYASEYSSNELWSYNPNTNTWTDRTPTSSPPGRQFPCLVYDSTNKVLVLFGGNGNNVQNYPTQILYNDTWTYDPGSKTWTNMSPAVSPSARELSGMAFHKGRGVSVLYGGNIGPGVVMEADTWAYDYVRNTWTKMTPETSPPPRNAHSMAYDPINDKVVLVGGVSPPIYNWRADSWSYDYGKNWTMGTRNAPSARSGHQMAYDSDTGETILFGGFDGALLDQSSMMYCGDTWSYNLSQYRWTLLSPTRACQEVAPISGFKISTGSTMEYDRRCKEIILYIPANTQSFGVYSFDPSTRAWTNKNSADAPRGDYTAMTYHDESGEMVVWQYQTGTVLTYDASSNGWTWKEAGPTQTDGSIVYLDTTGEIMAFGKSQGVATTSIYNYTNDHWTTLKDSNDPPAREYFSLAYASFRDEVVLYGGTIGGAYLQETWTFGVINKTWTKIDAPCKPARIKNHVIVYDKNEKETLLLGGVDQFSLIQSDIWTFDRRFFCAAGYYTSPANDTNGTAFFGNITWNADIPYNTTMKVQFRSGMNETSLNNSKFTGPNGTEADYYTESGHRINETLNNGTRWFQYRVFMNTSNERRSPILRSIQIRYNLKHNVTVTFPSGGEHWTNDNLPITWDPTYPDKDNLTFDVYLLDAAGGSTLLNEKSLPNNTRRYDWDTMTTRNGNYRIKVVAKDNNTTIPLVVENISGEFTIDHPNNRPVVTELIRPGYAQTVNSSTVELGWSAIDADDDPLTYYVFLGFVEFTNDSLPEVAAVTNETSVVITNLTNKATYFWSVIADDGKENSTMPEVSMFTVDMLIPDINRPPAVTLLAPQDGATVTTMSTQLSWTGSDADGNRLGYTVFLAEADFNLSGLPALFTRTNDTFLDTGNLTDGTTYYWAIMANDGKDNSTVLTVWKFTVHIFIPPDTPRIIEYSPNTTDTPLSPIIIIGFNMTMNSQSVFSALTILPEVNIIGFNSSGNRILFFLGSPLSLETRYNVTVSTGAKSIIGKNMFLPFNWSFTTLDRGKVDADPPMVLVADPLDGAQNVDKWKNVTIYFSEAMAQTPTMAACSISPAVNGSWQWKDGRGFAIKFNPTAGFSNGTYKVTVSRAATDESGNPLADNVTFSFKVGVPMEGHPKLLTKSLLGKGVYTDSILVLAFDRRMSLDSVREAFRISPIVDGVWTTDSEAKIFTFTPAKKFRTGTTYTITMSTAASDIEGNHLEQEARWSFTTASVDPPVGMGTTEWLLLALVIIVVAGIAAFAVTRRKGASGPAGIGGAGMAAPKGFAIEDIFLMYNDGRLIQHSTRRIKADMDVDIFTSMLTALQAFVKDSMGRGTGSELGSMEFGGDKILFEKGKYVIVAVVITGGEPAGFRDEMKSAVKNVESEYGMVLKDWDGGAAQLAGAKRFLAGLGAYKAAEEALDNKIKVDVSLKSEVEFYQGFVRLKVAIKNTMASVITHATFKLVYDKDTLRLDHIEPGLPEERGEVEIGIVGPGEKKTIAFYLDPQICTESHLEGVLTFKDAHGSLETVKMPRKLTSVVCPILFTEENINTGMLKRMAADELEKKDSKVFTIPSTMTTEKAFEVGKAAVQHHDVRLVRELKEDKPFRAEAWYYGKAKGRPDKLVVQVRVIPEMSFLEFSVSSDSVLMLTGMLAELKSDLNKELESHKLKGAMKQVVDQDDMEAVAEIRHLLEKATEAESESTAGKTEKE